MKLDDLSLLELLEIFRNGLVYMKDMSEELRKIDLVENEEGKLSLSEEYKNNKKSE